MFYSAPGERESTSDTDCYVARNLVFKSESLLFRWDEKKTSYIFIFCSAPGEPHARAGHRGRAGSHQDRGSRALADGKAP